MRFSKDYLYQQSQELLEQLIRIPSFSKEEDKTAAAIELFFKKHTVETNREGNNVWVISKFYDSSKPTILLNSHHDTVKPNPAYTRDPFSPTLEDGKLYGLGSNDAGGPLVSLIATFLYFYDQENLSFNLVLAATAEEEISGFNGIESVWSFLPKIDCAIVGEPTLTDIAIAEKGLLVIDCISKGKAGHAAREEGVNAIYESLKDIEWFKNYQFEKVSPLLGKIKMSVTMIDAGMAHNQVPSECKFTVDVRITDLYSVEAVLETIERNVLCQVKARSLRLRSSGIAESHFLIQSAKKLGKKLTGSPTTSDQALIPVSSIKMGPGDSARSHSADEFIFVSEIKLGIDAYINLLQEISLL